MGTVNNKQGPREDKRTREERRNAQRNLAAQVRRYERKSLSPWARLICLFVIGK